MNCGNSLLIYAFIWEYTYRKTMCVPQFLAHQHGIRVRRRQLLRPKTGRESRLCAVLRHSLSDGQKLTWAFIKCSTELGKIPLSKRRRGRTDGILCQFSKNQPSMAGSGTSFFARAVLHPEPIIITGEASWLNSCGPASSGIEHAGPTRFACARARVLLSWQNLQKQLSKVFYTRIARITRSTSILIG